MTEPDFTAPAGVDTPVDAPLDFGTLTGCRTGPTAPVTRSAAARSPSRAAAWSLLIPGAGHVYDGLVERAVTVWVILASYLALGGILLGLGILGELVRKPPPPIGEWIARHPAAWAGGWLLGGLALWIAAAADAYRAAEKVNAGEWSVPHSRRRQLIHIAISQLLGSVPFIGFLFPPGIVAEAIDATRDRRKPSSETLKQESKRALVEWAIIQSLPLVLIGAVALWALWWLLRAIGLPV